MQPVGSRYIFDTNSDGSEVEAVVIGNGTLSATCLTWGTIVQDLRHVARPWPLVLGLEKIADYQTNAGFLGTSVGRFANRIANGRFAIDGHSYQVDRNFLGKHHLHGGEVSFGRRTWQIAEHDKTSVIFSLHSPDGEGGYPGNLDVTCRYEINAPATLHITYTGTTDAPTLLNMAHHSYFNLNGGGSVRDHQLRIDADHYLPLDDTLIPTGEIAPVDGTIYDFRHLRPVGTANGKTTGDYDINLCLSPEPVAEPRAVAELRSTDGTVSMGVATTEPGLQLFDAATLDVAVPGLGGINYAPYSGLCLEAQRWPDAPNHPDYAGALLRPGETYRQVTEYQFAVT